MQNPASPSIECPTPRPASGAQGIARVAVDDGKAQLLVTFLQPVATPPQPWLFDARSYTLTGGHSLFPRVLKAEPNTPASPPQLTARQVLLTLSGLGDFSIYTLTVSAGAGMPPIDPFFSSHKLRFRMACDDPFDCRPQPPVPLAAPELPVAIDYLAKDYASFRQALLDFIPTRLPAWTERSEADIGIMLLELLAATADSLSYMQDRVGNEAFLDTATQRRSVAGHLALIGYRMDEGASAFTWLQFQLKNGATQLVNEASGLKAINLSKTDSEPIVVFEILGEARLDYRHNEIRLYTWHNVNCCLPRDAQKAELAGYYPDLKAGDYLLFDDGKGHRDIVRLTDRQFVPVAASPPTSPTGDFLTVVSWSEATPLSFDYCATDVKVRGNVVLATQGETVDETLRSDKASSAGQPRRLRFRLSNAPLAHLDPSTLALADRAASSGSTLHVTVGGQAWPELPTLLDSLPDDPAVRVEIDDLGDATVVFGDGIFGQRPPDLAEIAASYRVGGGTAGNIGADRLTVLRSSQSVAGWFDSVTNPLPATGGRNLESRDHARRFAPSTFRKPLVAVTTADYQAAAEQFTDPLGRKPVQRANAAFRWTGSWLTVFLTIDPRNTDILSPELRTELLDYLDTRRLAGYDLDVIKPVYIPVDLAIEFCPKPGFRVPDVEQALLRVLSNADLPNGAKGFFHPNNFSFGDNLYVSRIYEAAMAVPGIEAAHITRLARLHAAQPLRDTDVNLHQGFLRAGPEQILRLDNDRNTPQNGVLHVAPRGRS
jgi:hypothetical protein